MADNQESMFKSNYLIPAVLLSIGIAAGGFFAGHGLVKSRLGYRTVTVKGLAERPVKADLGFLPIRFTATGASLDAARATLAQNESVVKNYLKQQGFPTTAYNVQNIKVEDKWANAYGGQQVQEGLRYSLTEDIMVRSSDVNLISKASSSLSTLLNQGVVLSGDDYNSGAKFLFTKLNDLKPELLSEATKKARESAQKFAQESGAKVGNIQTANQGVIEVNPAIEIPNESGDKQIDKSVRVVTTVTYLLKD